MVEQALRDVVRQALVLCATEGLPAGHHFYLTFRTQSSGVEIPDHLRRRHPEEMTIVLQNQFWDLEVDAEKFSVSLTFNGEMERLVVPLTALSSFVDPHVKFGLQFNADSAEDGVVSQVTPANVEPSEAAADDATDAPATAAPTADVVALDAFRKK